MERIIFLGYPIDSLDTGDVLDWMEKAIQEMTPRVVTVVNANKLWQVSQNPRLAKILHSADLVLPEYAVYWGASRLKLPLKNYVFGVVVLKKAVPWAEKKGFRPFFLGARMEVIEVLHERLSLDYPGLAIAGMHHGYIRTPDDNEAVCRQIRESRADLLFVAMGSPLQEYWIEENFKKLNVPVAMGVGGSFDVLAGIKGDTPDWARGHGLEWLYRLSQDPKAYWKRYMVTNPWFVWQVLKAKSGF